MATIKIAKKRPGSAFTVVKPLEIPVDDYLVHLVVRKGPAVSRVEGPAYVEVLDLSGDPNDGTHLAFKMSIVDASIVAEQFPEFETSGLVATWRLQAADGLLKLVTAFDGREDQDLVRGFLVDSKSHRWARDRYKTSLGIEEKESLDVLDVSMKQLRV